MKDRLLKLLENSSSMQKKEIADLEESVTISNSKITLDLNQHVINYPCHDLIIINNGSEVTITGNGTMTNTHYQGIAITESKLNQILLNILSNSMEHSVNMVKW